MINMGKEREGLLALRKDREWHSKAGAGCPRFAGGTISRSGYRTNKSRHESKIRAPGGCPPSAE